MFQTGLIGLVGSLGVVSKIVLLVLFVFSVISWAIIFSKWRVFLTADREDKRFLALLAKTRDLDELYRQVRRIEGSPSASVFEGVMERVGVGRGEERDGVGSGLTPTTLTPCPKVLLPTFLGAKGSKNWAPVRGSKTTLCLW